MDSLFKAARPLYLASTSPRRIDFMRDLGLAFSILPPPDAAEPLPEPGEKAAVYALRAARAKAGAALPGLGRVFSSASPAFPALSSLPLVIAADTVVVLDGRIFGKPADPGHALAMLGELAGRKHEVFSACVLLSPPEEPGAAPRLEDSFTVRSEVGIRSFPKDVLAAYAACGEALDKAGGYAVQGKGAFLVGEINGSFSNVVGLPLAELMESLLRLGAVSAG